MVEFLVKKGAAQEHDVNGNTPLHCAALGGDPQVADYLYDDDWVEFTLLTVRRDDFYSKICNYPLPPQKLKALRRCQNILPRAHVDIRQPIQFQTKNCNWL